MTEPALHEASADVTEIVLHRRTWEIELLISGAIVVALFQLPGAVDALFKGLEAHVSHDLFKVVWSVYYPVKLAINPAIVVFVVHILLRGFWVGLVGLNAVYPDGIDWSKVNLPPIARAFHEPRTDPATLETRVDRAASLLFAVLFALLAIVAALGLWFAVGMTLVVVVASLPSTTASVQSIWRSVYFGIMIFLTLPGLVGVLIDKSCERWSGLARRLPFLVGLCRGLLAVGSATMLARLWYPAVVTIASNVAKKKPKTWQVVLFTMPLSVILSALVLVTMLGGPLYQSIDSYIFAPPHPQESGMEARHYDSLRAPGTAIEFPTIQSDILRDPFIRLYLPYDAWRDNDRLAELCREVKPFRRDGDLFAGFRPGQTEAVQRQSVLECVEKLWQVELNGTSLDLDPIFADEPGGRGRGVVAHIPTAELPPGKNELVITRHTTEEERHRRRYNPERYCYHIPFWR